MISLIRFGIQSIRTIEGLNSLCKAGRNIQSPLKKTGNNPPTEPSGIRPEAKYR